MLLQGKFYNRDIKRGDINITFKNNRSLPLIKAFCLKSGGAKQVSGDYALFFAIFENIADDQVYLYKFYYEKWAIFYFYELESTKR